MSEPRYIHVRNWERFQRFKDRKPGWSRLHFDLHRNDDYLALSAHRRAVLVGIWIEYGLNMRKDDDGHYTVKRGIALDSPSRRHHNTLGTTSLGLRLALRVTSADVEALSHAGFITISVTESVAWGDDLGTLEAQIPRELQEGSKEEGLRRAIEPPPGRPADEIVTEQAPVDDLPPVGPGISPQVREHVLKLVRAEEAA